MEVYVADLDSWIVGQAEPVAIYRAPMPQMVKEPIALQPLMRGGAVALAIDAVGCPLIISPGLPPTSELG